MKKITFILSLLILTSVSFAKDAGRKNKIVSVAPNTYMTKLENGLTVFISENHSVPLVYVEIAVRAGAITQTKENAGLFHLYEHMMFKGNSIYKNSAAVQKALSDMGTGSWNGTTGIECVNYYFTIPKKELKKGLEFWNAAIRDPLMDKEEFEVEKKVVISEIQGQYSNPDRIIGRYINESLFCDAPWQLDPSGSVSNVQNASIENLLEIKNKFYIPENAALFIGGDIDVKETVELVSEIFGDWSNNGVEFSEIEKSVMTQTKTPFDNAKYVVIPYDKISPQIAQINIMYRGPDADLEPEDTYAADFLHYYMNDPESPFTKELLSDSTLKIPNADYIGSGYSTRRRTGITSFTLVITNPKQKLSDRVLYAKNKIENWFLELKNNQNIISKENRKKILQRLKDDSVYETETSSGILSSLRYNWITNDIEYYKNYYSNVSKVKNKDLITYSENYIENKNPIVIVYVNSELYKTLKEDFDAAGFFELKY